MYLECWIHACYYITLHYNTLHYSDKCFQGKTSITLQELNTNEKKSFQSMYENR